MPTITMVIGEVAIPLTWFTTETNGGLWTMGGLAPTSLDMMIKTIHTMSGMIEWGNTGVRTGGQIRRAGTVAIITPIVKPRTTMAERHAAQITFSPIIKGALHKIRRINDES